MRLRSSSSRRLPFIVVVLAALVAGCSGPKSPTVFSVGSRTVTVDDFNAIASSPGVLDPYLSLPDSARKRALLEDLVNYETLAAAAEKDGLDKDSAYVQFDRTVPERVLPDALYEAKIGSQTQVSDDEARLYHERQNREYMLAVIMANDSTVLASLKSRLDRGEPFEEVARTGSQDPASAANGGKLDGWFTLDRFSLDVEDAIRPLAKGGQTGAIHEGQGHFVFKVIDVRPREQMPAFEEQKDAVKRSLMQRKRSVLANKYLAGIRRGYDLRITGDGWQVVNGVIVNLPDTLSRHLVTEPGRAGLSDEDLAATLATWKGRTYTVKDMIDDFRRSAPQDLPPVNRGELIKTYVEGKAMIDILVREAKKEGVDKTPKVARALRQERTRFLVQQYLAKAAAPAAPTMAELDSVTAAMVAAQGGAPVPVHYRDLPREYQAQIEQMLNASKQKDVVKDAIAKAKAELKPQVNEKVFDGIAWPVEPAEQENA
jgi:hypothetical protein